MMMIPRSVVLTLCGPVRRLAWGTLISSVGNGAWYTSWALFFTRSVHLTPAQIGIGMTTAGALGAVCTPVLGWLGDRIGARELFGLQLVVQGGAAFAYIPVHGMAAFVVVRC